MFDLDGTITRHDTLLPFVASVLRHHPRRVWRLPRVLPALVSFALGRADRGALKGAFLRATLGGLTRAELDTRSAQFVARLIAAGLLADARTTIERHRARGDRLALLSASTDLYVPAVGQALGFTDIVCTGVTWNGERLDGALATPNRRGAEKARCLTLLRERHAGLPVVAYGNASSDLQHLSLAERGVLVNGSRAARRAALRYGICCVRWR